MKNKEKHRYMLLNTGVERKGLAFSGIGVKSGSKGWPEKGRMNTWVEIGMAKREKNSRNHESMIYRSEGESIWQQSVLDKQKRFQRKYFVSCEGRSFHMGCVMRTVIATAATVETVEGNWLGGWHEHRATQLKHRATKHKHWATQLKHNATQTLAGLWFPSTAWQILMKPRTALAGLCQHREAART